jgi:hypothetical protein
MYQKGFIGRQRINLTTNAINYINTNSNTNTNTKNEGIMKFVHRVYLKDLQADRKYCYEITSGLASSHILSFRTSSPIIQTNKLNDADDYEAGAFLITNSIDLSQNQNLLSLETNRKLNALLTLNIIAYSSFSSSSSSFNSIQKSTSTNSIENFVPIAPSLLNENENAFTGFYPLNSEYPFSNKTIYSFNSQGVHFLTFDLNDLFNLLDVSSSSSSSLPMKICKRIESILEQIERDLKMIQIEKRHAIPWCVVYLPKELNKIDKNEQDKGEQQTETSAMFDAFVKRLDLLFYKYDVDLIFESNDFNDYYERSMPSIKSLNKYQQSEKEENENQMPIRISLPNYLFSNNPMVQNGTFSLTSISENNEYDSSISKTAFKYSSNSNFDLSSHSFGMLEILNKTHLRWSYFMYENQTRIESFIIEKSHFKGESLIERRQFLIENDFKLNDKFTKSFSFFSFFILFSLSFVIGFLLYFKDFFMKTRQQFRFSLNNNSNNTNTNLMNYTNLIETDFQT